MFEKRTTGHVCTVFYYFKAFYGDTDPKHCKPKELVINVHNFRVSSPLCSGDGSNMHEYIFA